MGFESFPKQNKLETTNGGKPRVEADPEVIREYKADLEKQAKLNAERRKAAAKKHGLPETASWEQITEADIAKIAAEASSEK